MNASVRHSFTSNVPFHTSCCLFLFRSEHRMLFLCFQPLDNFITNETFSISNYRIQRLLLFSKEKEKMNMIRHNRIAKELMTVLIQDLEESYLPMSPR
jgi:hypothetical protein